MQALYGGIDLLVAGLYRGLFGIASYCPADESYIRIDAVSDWSWNTCFKLDLIKEKANDWVLILKKGRVTIKIL